MTQTRTATKLKEHCSISVVCTREKGAILAMGGSVALISDFRPVNANHFLNGGANRYHTYMSQKGWVTSQMGSGQHRKTDLESSRNATAKQRVQHVQRPQLKLLNYSKEYLSFLPESSKCFQVAYILGLYLPLTMSREAT